MKSFAFFVVGFACAAVTWGQATVETAVGAGAATGAASGAKGAGQAVGGVFGAVSNVLKQAPKSDGAAAPSTGASSTISVTPSTAKVESVLTKPIDPSEVTIGMDRDQLLTRFGEPATRVSQIRRSRMIDTFWYATSNKDELIVSLTDGKVVSTVLASQRKRSTVASTTR
jgi:hypothetical protein